MEKVIKGISPLQQIFTEAKGLEQSGKQIINLAVGDPKVAIPIRIKNAALRAVRDNINQYIIPSGSADFLQQISIWYEKRGVQIDPKEIVAAGGSRIILDKVLEVLIEKAGDVVMIPAPYYPSFVSIAKAHGGQVEIIDTGKFGWVLDPSALELCILNLQKQGKNLKVLIINSPNNPTGAVIPPRSMEAIAHLAQRYDFWVISDECYQNFSSDKNSTFRKSSPNSILVDSASKTFAMTGYRVGWGVMPREIADKVRVKLGIHLSSFSSISERAAIAALRGQGIKDFNIQREMVFDWLEEMGLSCQRATAGFYAFPDCSKFLNLGNFSGSLDLARFFLNEAHVAVAPGIAFGDYDNYLRISYCVQKNVLAKALKRMEEAKNKLRKTL